MLDGSGIALGTYICKDSGANAETVFCEVIPQLPGVRICSIRAPNNAHLPKPGFEECGSFCWIYWFAFVFARENLYRHKGTSGR